MLTSGDVVALDLGLPSGSEAGFGRPAIVVTAQRVLDGGPNVVHVVPLTTTLRDSGAEVRIDPDPANGLDQRCAAQCQHLRAVSVTRLGGVRGHVGGTALARVRDVLGLLLDIPG
jgi:mRNA interferase MazF